MPGGEKFILTPCKEVQYGVEAITCYLYNSLPATLCPLFDRKITSRNHNSRKALNPGYSSTMKGCSGVLFGF